MEERHSDLRAVALVDDQPHAVTAQELPTQRFERHKACHPHNPCPHATSACVQEHHAKGQHGASGGSSNHGRGALPPFQTRTLPKHMTTTLANRNRIKAGTAKNDR